MQLCLAVPEILDREIWKTVYKMAAIGRTEVDSDAKFGVTASFVKLYLWSKFDDRNSNGLQTLKVTTTAATTEYATSFANSQLRWARC